MDGLTKLIPPPVRSKANPSLAGQGGAQIEATVPTKLRRGQVVKHHILWVTRPKPIIRERLCSSGADQGLGSERRGDESREHNQPSAGPSAAQPLCASVNEMAELLDDAVHHDHDVFRVPSAQRDEDDRKYLAHDCFLFQTGRLTGSWPYQTPKGSKQWSGRGAVLPTFIVLATPLPLHGPCAIFGFF